MGVPFPILNGNSFAWASAEIDFFGRQFYGIETFDFKEELEKEWIYGNGPVPIGWVVKQYKASASFTQYLSENDLLLQALGNGYGTKVFNSGIQWIETTGAGISTVEITGASIASREMSNAAGPSKVKIELFVGIPFKVNGLTIVEREAGFVGNVAAFVGGIGGGAAGAIAGGVMGSLGF